MNVILFDFDGTIADSITLGLRISDRLAQDFGFEQFSFEEFKQLQDLGSRELIRKLNLPFYKLPFLVRRFSQEMGREMHQLQLIPDMKETLLELKQQGNILGIVSTNSTKNIQAFLQLQHLENCFEIVVASYSAFGKHRLINRILKQHRFDRDRVFYVGDETRDVEAARKSKVKAIAVTWGLNSPQILSQYRPDFLIHTPHQLRDIFVPPKRDELK